MSQDSWNMRKGKTRISWVWKMRNNHYGVRKKARKHGKWGMKQDSVAWKFRTQNMIVTYTLLLRTNLEHFLESILYIPYIISKFGKSGVQNFKWCANRSLKWRSYGHFKTTTQSWRPFWNDFEIQFLNSKSNLWIRNPIQNYPNFEFTHCHFDVLPLLPRELHLEHSIHPKWALHD